MENRGNERIEGGRARNQETGTKEKRKFLQLNTGKGREAWELMTKLMEEENIDIAIIQEPYQKGSTSENYKICKYSDRSKVAILVKKNIQVLRLNQCSNDNILVLSIDENLIIINVYIEPGRECREDVWMRVSEQMRHERWKNVIIGGDFNAKHVVWGGEISDTRGESIINWTAQDNIIIWNRKEQGPTFENTRGKSWIDLTLSRGIKIEKWRIDQEEETLSDHKQIRFEIYTKKDRTRKKREIDMKKINRKKLVTEIDKFDDVNINQDLEKEVDRLQLFCKEACIKSMDRRTNKNRNEQDWWTNRLESLRKELRRKRRLWQEEYDEDIRNRKKIDFKAHRNIYKKEIKEEKIKYIKKRLETEEDPWKKINKLLKEEREEEMGTIRKEDGSYTKDTEETQTYLMEKYFPKKRITTDRANRQDKEETTVRTIQITRAEIQNICRDIGKDKAPGMDDMGVEVVECMLERKGEYIIKLYNRCLNKGVFPTIWKITKIVWLNKKDGGKRPICLEMTFGKVLDKIIAQRLRYELERKNGIDRCQYGFRANMGTIESTEKVIEWMKENKAQGKHVLLITLDIKNAFNSVEHSYIERMVNKLELKGKEIEVGRSFLQNRIVTTDKIKRDNDRGCPQGTCLGPILWLIVMEGWFEKMKAAKEEIRMTEGVCEDLIQAYADDQIIGMSGKSARQIERKWKAYWRGCVEWASESGLMYNGGKTEAMFVPSRKEIRPPTIKIQETQINLRNYIKYLGLTIDKKRLWIEHLQKIKEKIQSLNNRIKSITGKRWGVKKQIIKVIYEQSIRPIITYGACIWGERYWDTRIIKKLETLQRTFLLGMTRAFRTASNRSLEVIAGVPPLYIIVRMEYECRYEEKTMRERYIVKERERMHPAWRGEKVSSDEIIGTGIWTDASSGQENTGIGITWQEENGNWKEKKWRINKEISSVLAEVKAICISTETDKWKERGDITIITDSKSAITTINNGQTRIKEVANLQRQIKERKERLGNTTVTWRRRNADEGSKRADKAAKRAKIDGETETIEDVGIWEKNRFKKQKYERIKNIWQELWDNEYRGRKTYKFIRTVGYEMTDFDYTGTQIITGHGHVQDYYRQFKLRRTNGRCVCGEVEDVQHILEICTEDIRTRAREELERWIRKDDEGRYWEGNVEIKWTEENLRKISEYGRRVLGEDVFDER